MLCTRRPSRGNQLLSGRGGELRLIGRGATNEEIADQLVITEATVKTHITRIFDKLDLRDRAAAIVFAFDHGLVQSSPH